MTATLEPPASIADLRGMVFGRLTVAQYSGNKGYSHLWLCQCSCGKEKVIHGGNLRAGHTFSCGCYHVERTRATQEKHGNTKRGVNRAEYKIWGGMKSRCLNPNNTGFADYGGRGIRVCERWMDFANFLADMGNRPSENHSLDRFPNNDGDYEPGNCRWATPSEQGGNKRNNVFVVVGGEKMIAASASRKLGFNNPNAVASRLNSGFTVERAVAWPQGRRLRK